MSLEAQSITKEYKRKGKKSSFFALKNTDLVLADGELTVLKGRSGSGKSTLLNIFAGLSKPTSGKILLDGTDIYSLGDGPLSVLRNTLIGVIPQEHFAIHTLSVLQNVCLPSVLFHKVEDVESRGLELLKLLGISELAGSSPSELSGGELRRMSAARALINNPRVILADEPTGDLDDENTELIFELLRKKACEGASVLVVTHENDAEKYADRSLKVQNGTLEYIPVQEEKEAII